MNYDCKTKKESEWLVMVYLAGDNNLSAFSIGFLQELEAVKHNKNVRVVAAFDSTAPWPKGARYVEINRGDFQPHPCGKMDWPLHNDLVYPGHAVVSPDFCEKTKQPTLPDEPIAKEALARFFTWVNHCYTAKHYMLILFGHGTLVAGNTFLADTTPPSYIRLSEFSRILRYNFGKKLDILACDNCVMNGIETAVEFYGRIDFMIGSQSLALANGWPIRKIIEEVGDGHTRRYDAKKIAEKVLRACAKNVLDFALMERSSEQAIVDVRQFGRYNKMVTAVRGLSAKLQEGLRFRRGAKGQELIYPVVRDVVRLARLEAQSYWSETFVDLYDFAALLIERCNQFIDTINGMVNSLTPFLPSYLDKYNHMTVKDVVGPWPLIRILRDIAYWCKRIIDCFRNDEIVPHAYYVCPQLQYSHGISIYFPWTLPEGPITFEPKSYRNCEPTNYNLKTPFEEYTTYRFAQPPYGDWQCFLKAFFRATLRNVRVCEYEYKPDRRIFFEKDGRPDLERITVAIDLQKSGSDTGEPDDCECPQIKNYPRRFYLSPADCERRMSVYGLTKDDRPTENKVSDCTGRVSYLGWNIRGLLAEVIGLPPLTPPTRSHSTSSKKQ